MKVYSVTAIYKDDSGKEFHNEVAGVFSTLEKAQEYCEAEIKHTKSANEGEGLHIRHINECKGIESYKVEYKGWKNFTDYSSEVYRIKEFELK